MGKSKNSHNLVRFLPSIVVAIVSGLLLILGIGASWWPQDDGVFGYLAEAVRTGAVYGVDVHDFHGGYHTFLNAMMFHWFGTDVLVLRYPLVIVVMLQAGIVTFLLRRLGTSISFLSGLLSTVAFTMFPNPSPNWYALFFAIVSILILSEFRKKMSSYIFLGFVIGLCLMFRHPSAIFLSMGIFTYLLYDSRLTSIQPLYSQIISRLFLGILGLSIIFYSYTVFEPLAFIIFALPPLVLLFALSTFNTFSLRTWFTNISGMAVGGVVAVLPMIIYQLKYGSVVSWIKNSFLTAHDMAEKDFFSGSTFIDIYVNIIANYAKYEHLSIAVVQSVYVILIFSLPLLLFFLWLKKWGDKPQTSIHPAVFVASFFGLVSFYFQIPLYLFISVASYVVAVGLSLQIINYKLKKVIIGILIFINVVSIISVPAVQAIINPELVTDSQINNVSLVLENKLSDKYIKIYSIIDQYSRKDDFLYVFPYDPDIYFISERRNMFPFWGSTFSIVDDESYNFLVTELEVNPPTLAVYHLGNKYGSSYDKKLFEYMKESPNFLQVEDEEGYIFFTYVDNK